MNKNNNSAHEFAFYFPSTSSLVEGATPGKKLTISDPELSHRIVHIVRLKPTESFIIFDQEHHARCRLETTKKNKIEAELIVTNKNKQLLPRIIFFLPILKRESFQEAIYSLTELGVTIIQPIITTQIQRKWSGKHDHERSIRIIHAAAEQSKNFAFPQLNQPIDLDQALKTIKSKQHVFFFDPEGDSLFEHIKELNIHHPLELILMVGPEADLTTNEKKQLRDHNVTFCRLTPTILRAQQAVVVATGIFRSLLLT